MGFILLRSCGKFLNLFFVNKFTNNLILTKSANINQPVIHTFVRTIAKILLSYSNKQYNVGLGSIKGGRPTNEDFHQVFLRMPGDPQASFFAIYDGHSGPHVAHCAQEHLHDFVLRRPEYETNIEEALKQGFLDIDRYMIGFLWPSARSGSTAIVIIIKQNKLYCAHVGDSRAVACIKGVPLQLSKDHKPNDKSEKERILAAGGQIVGNRVAGRLAISRALGNFKYKMNKSRKQEEQIVTAYPDVNSWDITMDHEFIVLASDGIWNSMKVNEVVHYCRKLFKEGHYPKEICRQLMNDCVSQSTGIASRFEIGGDNKSVIMVCFLHGQSFEDCVENLF